MLSLHGTYYIYTILRPFSQPKIETERSPSFNHKVKKSLGLMPMLAENKTATTCVIYGNDPLTLNVG